MTDSTTARLTLPCLAVAQAQKEVTHNEALTLIDIALQANVEEVGVDAPPAAPQAGQCWIVGATPTGAWAGQAGALAGWTEGGWRFVAPVDGMAVWDRQRAEQARFRGDAWRRGEITGSRLLIGGAAVVGPRQGAVGDPSGGAVIDVEARRAISAMLAALRAHGLING